MAICLGDFGGQDIPQGTKNLKILEKVREKGKKLKVLIANDGVEDLLFYLSKSPLKLYPAYGLVQK